MKIKKAVLSSILSQGMLPLFFYEDAVVSLEVVRTLYNAGIRAIEYTNRGKEALDNFKAIKKVVNREMTGLYLGIGTVKNVSDAEAFIDAGADFIVAPIVNPEVGKVTHKHKLLWIPGCMTPTEIYLAQKNGADLIKIFPANVVGPGFISSIRELFPGQLFMPTGGVELEAKNIAGWFHAGACAVGMGSKLISKNIMDKRQYNRLHEDTVKAIGLVKAAL